MEEKSTMDFVEWCDVVLHRVIEVALTSPSARSSGIYKHQIYQALFGQLAMQPEFDGSTQREGTYHALRSLQEVSLLESSRQWSFWKPTKDAWDLVRENNMTPLRQRICQEKLGQEHRELLQAVNKLSPHEAGDHAWLEYITYETLLAELGWTEGTNFLWIIAEELEEWNLISNRPFIGSHECCATYRGLVWEIWQGLAPEITGKQFIVNIEKSIGTVIGNNNTVNQNFNVYR